MKQRPESIWVFYGGSSSEREVSLRSGKGVADALLSKGFKVSLLDISPGAKVMGLNWNNKPDIVFIGLHGTFGEDGVIQGLLESYQIPFVGSDSKSSALCFHKGLTKKLLTARGIPCPMSIDAQGMEHFNEIEKSGCLGKDFFERDWFLKPSREGSTVGIERYRGSEKSSKSDFLNLLKKCFSFDPYVLIEEWVEGREITVTVFNGKALPAVEIKPLSNFFDYESKYTKGKTEYLCPAPLEKNLELKCADYAEKSFEILECQDYGRIDMMIGAEGPKILEMNTLPGMTETSLVPKSARAAGMEYADFVEKLVCNSYKRQWADHES